MGMFDYLHYDAELPDNRVEQGGVFQTKAFARNFIHFRITSTGRLIEINKRSIKAETFNTDLDLDYHGDVVFGDIGTQGSYVSYVARFTNGNLEWIKSFEGMPLQYQRLFESKD